VHEVRYVWLDDGVFVRDNSWCGDQAKLAIPRVFVSI
jgi:hypothetical protein